MDKSVEALFRQRADPPQRYTVSYPRYLITGGGVRPGEYVQRFLAAEPGNATDMARFYFFCLAQDQIAKEGVGGDLAELGVYRGGTAAVLASIARRLGRTAYLLDTYEGFDEADLSGVDSGFAKSFTDTSLASVRALVGEDGARFIKGRFPDTASEIPPDARFCLVHCDCDLYAPMRSALEFFYPRLSPGGYLVVHDYSSLHWGGAEKAVDEFFADKPERPMPLPDCGGSVAVRRSGAAGSENWVALRRLSALGAWAGPGGGALSELLAEGWGAPEPWGIWGVGARHQLRLFLPGPPDGDVELEADVNAALVGSLQEQDVDLFVAGLKIGNWRFTRQKDRGARQVRIPRSIVQRAVEPSEWGLLAFTLEFRTKVHKPVSELDPGSRDDRVLGLALLRLRLRLL